NQAYETTSGRARLAQVLSSTIAHSLSQLALGRSDTLVLMSPSPAECRALAATLSNLSSRDECPAVVIELSPLASDGNGHLKTLAGDRIAEMRAAIDVLADATDERFALVTI